MFSMHCKDAPVSWNKNAGHCSYCVELLVKVSQGHLESAIVVFCFSVENTNNSVIHVLVQSRRPLIVSAACVHRLP